MDYESLKEQRRMGVIISLINIYPEGDKRRDEIIKGLKAGKDFTDDLKIASYIPYKDYSFLANQKKENLDDLLNVLSYLRLSILDHSFYYQLFIDYVTLFIGTVDTNDSKLPVMEQPDISLRNKDGAIEYGPYLEALGITDGRK